MLSVGIIRMPTRYNQRLDLRLVRYKCSNTNKLNRHYATSGIYKINIPSVTETMGIQAYLLGFRKEIISFFILQFKKRKMV